MAPIRLADSQLDAVLRAARPLRVGDRDAFLQDVAALEDRNDFVAKYARAKEHAMDVMAEEILSQCTLLPL